MNIKTLALIVGIGFGVMACSDGSTGGSSEVVINPNVEVIDNEAGIRASIQDWSTANPGKLVLPEGESIQTMEINALSAAYAAVFIAENPQIQENLDLAEGLKY